MIPVEDMRLLEDLSEEYGVSKLMLMEHAGKGLAEHLLKQFDIKKKTVVLFCGGGNNGGDGFVAARHLSEHALVYVLLFVPEEALKAEAAANYIRIKNNYKIEILQHKDINAFNINHLSKMGAHNLILVDALLGTGFKGELRQPYIDAIELFNRMKGYKVAVDVPSGIDAQTGEEATFSCKVDLIVTFHDKKPGLRGNIEVVDIGIPKEAVERLK